MLFDLAQTIRRNRMSLFVLAGLILALQVLRAHVHRFGEHDALYGHSHATEMHVLDMDTAADPDELIGEAAVIDDLLVKFSGLALAIPVVALLLLLAIPPAPRLRAPPSVAARRLSFLVLCPPLRAPPR